MKLAVVLFIAIIGLCQAVYLTMTDIKMNLTVDRNKIRQLNKRTLATIKIYIGGIFLIMSTIYVLYLTDVSDMSSHLTAKDDINTASTSFDIKLRIWETQDCDILTVDMCFWSSASYVIEENAPATVIGSLSSPYFVELCTEYKINYMLIAGEDDFRLLPPSHSNRPWEIATSRPLDRDILAKTSTRHPEVLCTVENPQGTRRNNSRTLNVVVVDVNDNPPVAQEEELNITLPDDDVYKGQEAGHASLIFHDKDSFTVNNYTYTILNDYYHLLEPACEVHENDYKNKSQTAVACKLKFTRNAKLPYWNYSVILQVNDTSLRYNGKNRVAAIPIHLLHNAGRNLPSRALHLGPSLLLYHSYNVSVFRTAALYARITQPSSAHLTDKHNFSLVKNEHNRAFDVTPEEGIVYVSKVDYLRKASSPVRLQLTWIYKGSRQTDEIYVEIVDDANSTCGRVNNWKYCSKYNRKESCENANLCGIGTGGEASMYHWENHRKVLRCMWGGPDPPRTDTPLGTYSTCTPEVNTCPDKECDALEKLHPLICPQDCTYHVLFPTHKNEKTGRGIGDGRGVCTCDDRPQCMCNNPEKQQRRMGNSTKSSTSKLPSNLTTNRSEIVSTNMVSRRTGIDSVQYSSCGTTCMLSIAGGIIFLIGAVAMVVACWRVERVHKAVIGKFSQDTQDLSAPLSDYVDRGVLLDNLQVNFDMTRTIETTVNKYQPDPKWEFPRNQLIIEQTLGEGEFGRVLRARALDITGQTGYTTVAVKTLKDDARETELTDLLSEYQLLKDVSHPNIIRLLGACTIPGGPVYLIIEFAEYGSLRNYLRRSRHLKSESHLPSTDTLDGRTDHYDEPNIAKVTPQEILSFAWQICNGMAYLSDVKLVHRDLAARNVLLAEGKICKISDFGLTRDIYEDDAYFKKTRGRVPVKWMAPESLSDHVYTSKSDVWSFGILVWELVTLGATPYPGISVQNLYHLIRSGYRMERPENCSPSLYKVVQSCWALNPDDRPTFHELVAQWEKMLSDQVEYLDLTNNAIHNRSYFCSPFEDTSEQDSTDSPKSTTREHNYLSKSQSCVKCGETDKMLEQTDDTHANITQGYETPIKVQKLPTPTNENPQYYTDMAGKKLT